MHAAFRAAFLFAIAALVALQVTSAAVVERDLAQEGTPTLYDYARRNNGGSGTAVPNPNPSGTKKPGEWCKWNGECTTGRCGKIGKCLPTYKTGQINTFCDADDQCSSGLYCYRTSCQTIKEDGHACYKASGCKSGSCVNKKCASAGNLPQWSPCTQSNQCKQGLFCNRIKCDYLKKLGDYCYRNNGCYSGVCKRNTCTKDGLKKIGTHCKSDGECISQFCHNDQCTARREEGRKCWGNDFCKSNKCKWNKCQKP